MSKYRIFTVNFDLPGDAFERVDYCSNRTLLDADITLFIPQLGALSITGSYQDRMLLDKSSSFTVKKQLDHWKSEIGAAVSAGKLVVVYLVEPVEYYRFTGRKTLSGTGANRSTSNGIVSISSYDVVPGLKTAVAKQGTEVRLEKEAVFLLPYWSAFSAYSSYQVEITGDFTHVLLKSRAGNRIVGASIQGSGGALLLLPPLDCDRKSFLTHDPGDHNSYWTEEALQFGKKLAETLVGIASVMMKPEQVTPPPSWVLEPTFRLPSEPLAEPLWIRPT